MTNRFDRLAHEYENSSARWFMAGLILCAIALYMLAGFAGLILEAGLIALLVGADKKKKAELFLHAAAADNFKPEDESDL